MLACTPISPPDWFLRSSTNSARSPSMRVARAQSDPSGVEVATYFCTPLMNVENGSMSLVGQNRAHSS
jgi:hypothetical protein